MKLCDQERKKGIDQLYALIKQNRIDWDLFAGSKLTRLNTLYVRPLKTSDPTVEDFFIETEKEFYKTIIIRCMI